MPSPFAALEDMVSDAIDATFGEAFEFRPMAAGNVNAAPAADGTREMRTITAIFSDHNRDVSAVLPNRGMGGVSKASAQFSGSESEIDVDERQFGGDMPRQKDRFVRLDTLKTYEVSDIRPDGMGRAKLRLRLIATAVVS